MPAEGVKLPSELPEVQNVGTYSLENMLRNKYSNNLQLPDDKKDAMISNKRIHTRLYRDVWTRCGIKSLITFLYYEGEAVNCIPDGEGTIYHPNGGVRYKGGFKNNKFDGYGEFFTVNGTLEYVGYWRAGKKHGMGKFYEEFYIGVRKLNHDMEEEVYGKNLVYYGQWENDQCHGEGTTYNKQGVVYKGQWRNNTRHGTGTVYENGVMVYEGGWKNDLQDGMGTIYYYMIGANGKIPANISKYVGQIHIKNGLDEECRIRNSMNLPTCQNVEPHGKGETYYNDENLEYEGDMYHGLRHGKGYYYDPDGNCIYAGEWKKGQRDGNGISYKNGVHVYNGQWKKNFESTLTGRIRRLFS